MKEPSGYGFGFAARELAAIFLAGAPGRAGSPRQEPFRKTLDFVGEKGDSGAYPNFYCSGGQLLET